VTAAEFHDYCIARQARWPQTMTALSTHDTKRSEDVRARLAVLTHDPSTWAGAVKEWSEGLTTRLDHATEQLLWQTAVGAWPIDRQRLLDYATKAVREAKLGTSWLDPQEEYEQQVTLFVDQLLEGRSEQIQAFVDGLTPSWRSVVLAQKLVQLTMPGVADCYQGTELVALSLVDPDNRRPVDYDRAASLLRHPTADLDSEKQQVVRAALGLRREHPEWFLTGSSYEPLDAAPGTLAFSRSDQLVVAVPLRGGVAGEVSLPEGDWKDLLPGLPVSLLVRA
jgi:(1->4)-alpha-D-glucan 1-alpha-D-glucosylmutase